ncbi:hypothetical protein CP960_00955 [Malaciobacter halophilus]|uniref:Uncharacterized protein n=1 Tax=Malaciobacter halophilus TaxID=197482 RepID=A0A2N1J681_9BACT|nr:hypothetical protein [Malaciobacter halophilus]AXH08830.1 putative membrane protein [Malaciobacter halophilus]PKI82060.1 hypothetical protein CP960_00955 [Malaciobacter halophilus]
MLNITYKKEIIYKLYMLVAFAMFALVMYQGYLQKGGVYTLLLFLAFFLMAFQVASIIYVLLVKRTLELKVENNTLSWTIFDNKRVYKKNSINIDDIKQTTTEINYLTGNIYSSFTATFILKDDTKVELTDGILYDFGLEKSEEIATFLLKHNLGDEADIRFSNLVEQLNIDIKKEQKFTKKDGKSYVIGVISKNKKEFLALRLQVESLFSDYNDVQKNTNNQYLVKNPNLKDSYISIRSNPIGYMVEFYNVNKKCELKMLKEFKGATIKNKLANIVKGK